MNAFDHRRSRWAQNVCGQFYVDQRCLYCDRCRTLAPTVFKRDEERGFSHVARQPKTEREVAQAYKAVFYCPQQAIHDDGLEFDWNAIPSNDCHSAA
jgi:ferredoxin